MIEDCHNLEIVPVGQRQDLVAGAEPWMETAVGKCGSQLFPEPLRSFI